MRRGCEGFAFGGVLAFAGDRAFGFVGQGEGKFKALENFFKILRQFLKFKTT
jgi:hypothetical protein